MKVVIVNTSDTIGGAAIAARRLTIALNKHGLQATMLVQEKKTSLPFVRSTTHGKVKKWLNFYRFAYERFWFYVREKSKAVRFLFAIGNTGEGIASQNDIKESDIVHLHWINNGFLSLHSLKQLFNRKKPVVWTLHDMWAFTGGCYHSGECNGFQTQCGNCPFLRKPWKHDLSNRVWKRKHRLYPQKNIVIVTCSEWLKIKAMESSLLKGVRIVSIPNPIDIEVFKPQDKLLTKSKMKLNVEKVHILFVAVNVNNYFKGFTFFKEALILLKKLHNDIAERLELIVFGRTSELLVKELPFNCMVFNNITDEVEVSMLYNASDLFVTTSLQENLPNTIMESMACGIPSVGFNVGGIPEMIDHKETGYIAQFKSAEDIAAGIVWCLSNNHYKMLSENARQKVLNCYSEQIVAEQYKKVYDSFSS